MWPFYKSKTFVKVHLFSALKKQAEMFENLQSGSL